MVDLIKTVPDMTDKEWLANDDLYRAHAYAQDLAEKGENRMLIVLREEYFRRHTRNLLSRFAPKA
jgi:hypothetical protein